MGNSLDSRRNLEKAIVLPGADNSERISNELIKMGANPFSQSKYSELEYQGIPFTYATPQTAISDVIGVYLHGNSETAQMS